MAETLLRIKHGKYEAPEFDEHLLYDEEDFYDEED
jgi:hypothetical protein